MIESSTDNNAVIAAEYEKKGYDAWLEQWVAYGMTPPVSSCPARYMQEGFKRSAYLRGWRKAMSENKE